MIYMDSFHMKRDLKLLIMKLMMVMMMVTMVLRCVSAKLHHVGGRHGWTQNVNFTEWANHEHFYVHDWLIFKFDKHMYSVLEVNKTNYEKCRDEDFITNITKGGRDVFELREARTYYFLSGRGFCWGGMKVAIFVQQTPPPPAPLPASSKRDGGSIPMTLLLAFSLASFLYI